MGRAPRAAARQSEVHNASCTYCRCSSEELAVRVQGMEMLWTGVATAGTARAMSENQSVSHYQMGELHIICAYPSRHVRDTIR